MQCVILAAGVGSRLQLRGDSKPLVPVYGVPLIERVVDAAVEAGSDRFLVVTGHRAAKLSEFLAALAERKGVVIETVHNENYELENGYSALAARDAVEEPFVLLMADHLFLPESLRRLTTHRLGVGEVALAVDTDVDNADIDLDDVTRVLVEDGRIRQIGKGLERFNAFDTGMFWCTSGLFEGLEEACRAGDTSLSAGIRWLAGVGRAAAVPIGDVSWIDVDDPEALHQAEQILRERMREEALQGASPRRPRWTE